MTACFLSVYFILWNISVVDYSFCSKLLKNNLIMANNE